MTQIPSFARRLLLAGGFTLGALAPIAIGVPAASAAGPATLTIASVTPGGTQADVVAITSEPTTIGYSVSPATANPNTGGVLSGNAAQLATGAQLATPVRSLSPALGQVAKPPIGGVLDPGLPPPHFDTKHQFRLTGLKPNTTYDLSVGATTQSGEHLLARTRFTTLKQRIRVTFESIEIHDDGDVIGNGEPTWFYHVAWPTGSMKDCFPQSGGHCREGDYDEGVIIPSLPNGQSYNYILAEENFRPMPGPGAGEEDFTTMPTTLWLGVSAKESDSFLQSALDGLFDGYAAIGGGSDLRWDVPQGVESVRERVQIGARDGNFSSTVHFRLEVFYNNQTYAPNFGRIHASVK